MRELREKAEKFQFQTEVNRMMKLIINSLYRNKEVLINFIDESKIFLLIKLCNF